MYQMLNHLCHTDKGSCQVLLRPSIERELIANIPVYQKLQARMGGVDNLTLLDASAKENDE